MAQHTFYIYLKKIKIIFYIPLALFFIVNLFYFSLPAKAAPNDTMPQFQIPELQIKIPTLNLTPAKQIKCENTANNTICFIPWIGEYIAGVYKYAIGIVGILAAVMLMVGGIIWITAGGSATQVGNAKSYIAASLTGLVIALCSYLILYQINPALTIFQPLKVTLVKTAPEVTPSTGVCKWASAQGCLSAALGGPDAGWVTSDASLCTEEQGTNKFCCCLGCKSGVACEPCIGCMPLNGTGITTNGPPFKVSSSLVGKLVNSGVQNLRVSEGWPPQINHSDPCHKNGTCVDISAPTSIADIKAMAQKLQIGNLNATYEPEVTDPKFGCALIAPYPCNNNSGSTGSHFHVK